MDTRKFWNLVEGLKPAMTMVVVQIILGGQNIMYKLARDDGMIMKILVAYRNIFAAAIMLPLALIIEGKSRPKMTWMIFLQASLCGLLGGSLGQNLFAETLSLMSATMVAAMTNLVPAISFVMAVVFRMERLAIGTIAGTAKVVGTIISLGGAMILTFYKGAEIKLWSTNINLLHHDHGAQGLQDSSTTNTVLGSLLALVNCVTFAAWLIIQTKMSVAYPIYSGTALTYICASIQSIVYAICTERDWPAWKLGWNVRLLVAVYSGVLASGLIVAPMAWVSRTRGPIFVSSFFPTMVVTVAILGSLLLGENLHIGSVIAAVFVIVGLYIVLWGKGKEMKQITNQVERLKHVIIENSCNNSECKSAASGIIVPSESA